MNARGFWTGAVSAIGLAAIAFAAGAAGCYMFGPAATTNARQAIPAEVASTLTVALPCNGALEGGTPDGFRRRPFPRPWSLVPRTCPSAKPL